MPSFYQDGLFNALSASGKVDLEVVYARNLGQDREQLGWQSGTKIYPYQILSARPAALTDALRIARRARQRIHIINGIWAEPAFAAALCALGLLGSRFAIHSESPDLGQPPAALKKIMRARFGKWVARRAAGLFAVSHFAADFYSELGFNPRQIYPFGYFRAGADLTVEPAPPKNRAQVEIIFVGQLIHRKGIDILFSALQPLFAEHRELKLTLIGIGEAGAALKKQAADLRILERVEFIGARPSNEIPGRIAQAQVLVLPSRWDGWGLVVNEALAVGVPVIVSNRCGAMDLIQPGLNGFIFRSEDAEDLRRAVHQFLENRPQWSAMKAAAHMTGTAVSAENAAAYLIDCLRHLTQSSTVRPVPPWGQLPLLQSTEF